MTSETYDESFKKDCGYKDICQIKSGKFATVYKATCVDSGEVVAVKVLKIDKNDLKENKANMRKEIKFLSKINHTNIITMVDSNISKGRLVLELAKGGDLLDRTRLWRNFFGSDELFLWHVFKQVVDATDYLHNELRIQHNDIKPENILLMTKDKRPKVKLTDFNVSSLIRSEVKRVHGTVQYSAPEILKAVISVGYGNKTPTITQQTLIDECKAKVDVWAIGMALYKCCTYGSIFSSPNPETVLKEIENKKMTDNVKKLHVSSHLKTFLEICLEIEQEDRASIKDLKGHEWFKTAPVDDQTPLQKNYPMYIILFLGICVYLFYYPSSDDVADG